jgi:hypothetical protein
MELPDIKSKRIKGGGLYTTPLKKFKGTLEKYEVIKRAGQYAKEGDVDVVLDFIDLQVIETDTPFPYNVARFALKFSNAEGSSWTLLEDSIATALGTSVEDVRIQDIVGKQSTWEREDNHVYSMKKVRDATTGLTVEQPMAGTVWRVVDVVGGSGGTASALDQALTLLEGKKRTDFIGVAAGDAAIRKDAALLKEIMSKKFFENPIVTAMYTEVAGVFTKI